MLDDASNCLGVVVVGAIFLHFLVKFLGRKSPSVPPGPSGLPVLGHLLQIPLHYPEVAFHKLGQLYGDLVYMYVPGRKMVVVNNRAVAEELLEKRGANYSDRPRFTMLVEMMGWDPTLTLMPYSKRSQKHRRMLQQYLAHDTLKNFQVYQIAESKKLISKLISDDAHYEEHVKLYILALIMKIAFGHEISEDDQYVKMAHDVTYTLDNSGAPGATPPDLLPSLKHVPSWLPGASFATFAKNWRKAVRLIHDLPYQQVKEKHEQGTANACFLNEALENSSEDSFSSAEHVEDIKGVAANIFCAGNDTTFGTILCFMLAMVLNPEVQERAAKELDEVVGRDRLPTFEDRSRLRYVECVVQETLRWHPVLPLGIPHKTVQADIYQGYHVPAKTVVIANAYGMSRDEKVYQQPHEFRPERFLPKPDGNGEPYFDPSWGFGRRVCPGKPLADASFWIAAATILSTVQLSAAGSVEPKFVSGGIVSYPERFPCRVEVRDAVRASLLH
ncbi:hypothetical protein D9758_009085 [Tetrapyrgos nigripes]|uniref:Cytochrome P450 n=1 Tax=Tetrapyrgos nigripes TaxID=182062 RepID=A0A8H5LKR8_9AGAR|nr:hypothetical protein D9758_009085 [Tetrapyrgos nigripes]